MNISRRILIVLLAAFLALLAGCVTRVPENTWVPCLSPTPVGMRVQVKAPPDGMILEHGNHHLWCTYHHVEPGVLQRMREEALAR
jgi:hypothetical protein